MKHKSLWIFGAVLSTAVLFALSGCSSTPSSRTRTTVHVGVGFHHPYTYGPGWGYYPPRPPIPPPVRPPPSPPRPTHPIARPPSGPIGPSPRPPVVKPRGG